MHILHIGYPKAASTFLQQWFQKHPQITYQHHAIAGLTQSHDICKQAAATTQSTDKNAFAKKIFVTSHEKFSVWSGANATNLDALTQKYDPLKIYQQNICNTLHTLFPEAKILIITRNVHDLLKSGYSQVLKMGSSLNHLEIFEYNQNYFLDIADYNYLINLYAQKFGIQNLIVLPFELLNDQPQLFMQILEQKMELTPLPHNTPAPTTNEKVNASLQNKDLYWYPKVAQTVLKIGGWGGATFQKKLFTWYRTKLYYNRLDFLFAFLKKISPQQKNIQIPTEILKMYEGKATILKNFEGYQNYYKKYLID